MKHDIVEKNMGLMIVLVLFVISLGGLAESVPLFFIKQTTEPVAGLKPLPALELEGRDIYIREGCNVCHSQMIRPFKRTGPDLARVGKRYSDEWHRAHLYNPRDVVPESNMPPFPWLFTQILDGKDTGKKMEALRKVGVPYTDTDIAGAGEAVAGSKEIDALVAYLQQLGTVIQGNR